jgi:hypothetical protein
VVGGAHLRPRAQAPRYHPRRAAPLITGARP